MSSKRSRRRPKSAPARPLRKSLRLVIESLERRDMLRFGEAVTIPLGEGREHPTDITTGDFDGDGELDVAAVFRRNVVNGTGIDSVAMLKNEGGTLTAFPGAPFDATALWNVRTGDFNGDGFGDLLTFDQKDVVVYQGAANGQFPTATTDMRPFDLFGGEEGDATQDLQAVGFLNGDNRIRRSRSPARRTSPRSPPTCSRNQAISRTWPSWAPARSRRTSSICSSLKGTAPAASRQALEVRWRWMVRR